MKNKIATSYRASLVIILQRKHVRSFGWLLGDGVRRKKAFQYLTVTEIKRRK